MLATALAVAICVTFFASVLFVVLVIMSSDEETYEKLEQNLGKLNSNVTSFLDRK